MDSDASVKTQMDAPIQVVLAAGGLLWHPSKARHCAVICRRRYGPEQTLPKGKLKPGESLLSAALREVREETGYDATVLGYAGSIDYRHDHVHKIVFFWHLSAAGDSTFQPSEEVEKVEWLTVEDAMTTLSHPKEKEILSKAAPMANARTGAVTAWFQRLHSRLFTSARYDRLSAALRVTEVEIERRIHASLTDPRPPAQAAWQDAALVVIGQAHAAVEGGRIDEAWKLLLTARRIELLGMEAAEREAVATVFREEATKLKSWRQKAVEGLLGTSAQPKPPSAECLYHAAVVLHEHYNNQAYKDRLLRTQVIALVGILVVVLAALAGIAVVTGSSSLELYSKIWLFGLLGASVSAMLRSRDSNQSAPIPEITSALRVTFMRVLMGGAAALIVYVFFKSKIMGMFNQDFVNTLAAFNPYTDYAVAFAAGFSERLVLRAVEFVAGK